MTTVRNSWITGQHSPTCGVSGGAGSQALEHPRDVSGRVGVQRPIEIGDVQLLDGDTHSTRGLQGHFPLRHQGVVEALPFVAGDFADSQARVRIRNTVGAHQRQERGLVKRLAVRGGATATAETPIRICNVYRLIAFIMIS